MAGARSQFRRFVGSAAGRLAASAAMLGAAALVVLATGGGGLLGSLGALVGGGSRSAVEPARATATGASPPGAIVAAAPVGSPAASTPAGGRGRPRLPGRRGPGRPRVPGGAAPRPRAPGGGAPAPGGGRPAPGGGGAAGGGGETPPRRGAVETAGETVREVGRQAPPPARPLGDGLGRLADDLVATCRRLPACP